MTALSPRQKTVCVAASLLAAVTSTVAGAGVTAQHNLGYPVYSVAVVDIRSTLEATDSSSYSACAGAGCSIGIGYAPPRVETAFGLAPTAVQTALGIIELPTEGVASCRFPLDSPRELTTGLRTGTAYRYSLQRVFLGFSVGEPSEMLTAFASDGGVSCGGR